MPIDEQNIAQPPTDVQDNGDEQIHPDSRRGRCIAPIADVSALSGGSSIPLNL